MIKVLFISRASLFAGRGGDTVQIEKTAEELRKLGLDVDIELCDNRHIDYRPYDLLHFFNIIRPADMMYHIDKSKKPFAVSPIYVEYAEQLRFYRDNFKNRILSLLDKHRQEYIKCIARAFRGQERIISKKYFFMGHKRSISGILERCSLLLPNSQSEYERLKTDFPEAMKYEVIPNGVDTDIFHPPVPDRGRENKMLCVARIEPQKNQLNLIRAVNGTPWLLTLAGMTAPNHQRYYRQCREAAGANVHFAGFCSPEQLAKLYGQHQVHILPSWFETTGLSSLEAAACGCNIVITDKGDSRAYFGNHACYCEPSDPGSIRKAIAEAMRRSKDGALLAAIRDRYNWKMAARKTVKAYQQVLGT